MIDNVPLGLIVMSYVCDVCLGIIGGELIDPALSTPLSGAVIYPGEPFHIQDSF